MNKNKQSGYGKTTVMVFLGIVFVVVSGALVLSQSGGNSSLGASLSGKLNRSQQISIPDIKTARQMVSVKTKEVMKAFEEKKPIIPFSNAKSAVFRGGPRTDCLNLDSLKDPQNIVTLTNTNMNYACPEVGWSQCVRVCAATYQLTQTNIMSNDVSVYCESGTTIHGNGGNRGFQYSGTGRHDIKIRNCTIENFQWGIVGAGNQTEIADNIVRNTAFGMLLYGSSIDVERNSISSGDGIYFFALDPGSVLRRNQVTATGWGIIGWGGQIIENTINGAQYGMVITSLYDPEGQQGGGPLVVKNNQIGESSWYNMFINFNGGANENLLVKDNSIRSGIRDSLGIALDYLNDKTYDSTAKYTISNNNIQLSYPTTRAPGISIDGRNYNRFYGNSAVTNNIVTGGNPGISIAGTDGIKVIYNNVKNSPLALQCDNSQQITWQCNNCNGGGVANANNCAPLAICGNCGGGKEKSEVYGNGAGGN